MPFSPEQLAAVASVLALAAACLGGWAWFFGRTARRLLAPAPGGTPWPEDDPLDWPDLAYLSGGRERVFQAATVWLVQNGVLGYEPADRRLVALGPLPPGAVDAAAEVSREVARAGGRAPADAVRKATGDREGRLVARQLTVPVGRRRQAAAVGWVLFPATVVPAVVPFAAAGLVAAAVDRDLGVALLTLTFGGFGAVLLYGFGLFCVLTSRVNTPLGDRVLGRERRRVWPDRPFWFTFHPPPDHLKADLAVLVAAFGPLQLARTEFAALLDGLSDPAADCGA